MTPDPADELREALLQQIAELNRQLPPADPVQTPRPLPEQGDPRRAPEETRGAGAQPLVEALQSSGLLPVHARYVADHLPATRRHARYLPDEAIAVSAGILRAHWRRPAPEDAAKAHVFIGGPGAGKTTCLCKWLAQVVLLGGRAARVWRLDGQTANTGEVLNVYGAVLDVPVERSWPGASTPTPAETRFVDLPGVNWHDGGAVRELAARLAASGPAQIHLVLNAAYETPLLLAQVAAFGGLPLTDLIFTHLDEETRPGKLWNFVFGTNCAPGYLSAGQNVPGNFLRATPENISSGGMHAIARDYAPDRGS